MKTLPLVNEIFIAIATKMSKDPLNKLTKVEHVKRYANTQIGVIE